MADTKREIERKFEFPRSGGKRSGTTGDTDGGAGTTGDPGNTGNTGRAAKPGAGGKAAGHGKAARRAEPRAGARHELPDLTGTAAIAAVHDRGTDHLDAVYYDTPDQRLAADGLTLRRRTGGEDSGWHLKLPVAPGVRDEIQAPLADTVPPALAALVRSRVRDHRLEPQVRLRSERRTRDLLDADGTLLAQLSTDTVHAERGGATADWTEVEVELADGTGPALLDAVEQTFQKAGLKVSEAPSKLARALAETGSGAPARPAPGPADGTAGAHVLAYLRRQVDTLISCDPAVRRDQPDSVHRMRVASRRLRSAFKTYRKILDREVTDPIGEELRRLGTELGADRDREVLHDHLREAVAGLPHPLLAGPVHKRLRTWNSTSRSASRRRALAALDDARYLTLLDTLEALLADPPLLPRAAKPAGKALPKAILRDYRRLARRVDRALTLGPGQERDRALHEARKAAKRARYGAEAAEPALGKPANKFAKAMEAVQDVLGEHQDSVVTRNVLRDLAHQAHGAGEPSFTWGLLHGREEARAERTEGDLPAVWARASRPKLRSSL
ncbi:CHAD domain-containing protein [Streptomyces sp. NPDC012794]|uniref:CYTH and CHAD domain-containing protein n=1 Tax=Streptomyces sp. NPDC012794 TaxID=3364850 RepID=UPI0036D022D2